jgi:GTP-binding protein Era
MSAENETLESKPEAGFRTATVAVIGRPNAGKSTLLNALLDAELSGVSARPQTTRSNIKGILQLYGKVNGKKKWTGQLVIADTPGVNLRKGLLDRSMYSAIEDALRGVDGVVWVADCRTFKRDLDDLEQDRPGEDKLFFWLKDQMNKKRKDSKWILVLSKADMKSKEKLLPLIELAARVMPQFTDIIPLSALKGQKDTKGNVKSLIKVLEASAPEAAPLYPEDTWTDVSERDLVQNLVREAIFQGSYKEVPYESDCEIFSFKEPTGKQKMAEVDANIVVSRDSLKRILIGKGGAKIRDIGKAVRVRYKDLTGDDIVLRLNVKVEDKWQQRPKFLKELGYAGKE